MTTRFADHLLEGDHASRPAFGDVPEGTLYACSDHDLIYQSDGVSAWSTWATLGTGTPAAHASSHEDGGADEIDVTGLVGAGGTPNLAIYKRTSAAYTTGSASLVDVDATNLALNLTTGANRVEIGLVGSAEANAASAVITFDVLVDAALEGGGTYGLMTIRPEATASYRGNVSFTWITDALSAAAHTFKLQWKTSGGTATLHGDSSTGQVMQFWVREIA